MTIFYSCLANDNFSGLYYITPSTLDRESGLTCSSPNVKSIAVTTKSKIEEAVRTVIGPYLDNKYGPILDVQCSGTGWTRMVYLNMSDNNSHCPTNWTLKTSGIRGCGRKTISDLSCDSTIFTGNAEPYSRVCGRIIAYQRGHPDGFAAYYAGAETSLDSSYSSGVLLTHGPVGSKQHIWTFSAALAKQGYERQACPCNSTNSTSSFSTPPFVGNNYFCDSGNPGPGFDEITLYTDDPLWDGAGCPSSSMCCQFNNPPWFSTVLPSPTMDPIEARLCLTNRGEDVLITFMELYVAN